MLFLGVVLSVLGGFVFGYVKKGSKCYILKENESIDCCFFYYFIFYISGMWFMNKMFYLNDCFV